MPASNIEVIAEAHLSLTRAFDQLGSLPVPDDLGSGGVNAASTHHSYRRCFECPILQRMGLNDFIILFHHAPTGTCYEDSSGSRGSMRVFLLEAASVYQLIRLFTAF